MGEKAKTAQNQSTSRLTPLDLSRITFNDDISYLSPAEQERYRKCQAEFSKSLKQLPSKQRKELQEAYKWVPDVVKIIASRDYQDRKEYIQQFKPGLEPYSNLIMELRKKKKQIPRFIELFHIINSCQEMLQYRYPLQMIDPLKKNIEGAARQCGFGYLSKMIDFCADEKNYMKTYQKSTDASTYKKTSEEMEVFRDIGLTYETQIWLNFWQRPFYAVPKFWEFDLKKVDTSNLTPAEYAKMEKQLQCVPPGVLVHCRHKTYDSRMSIQKHNDILKSPTYIKKYAQSKGIRLSNQEAQEVHQLASELMKYGMPLKLVKRDEQADLGAVADNFGFSRVWAFDAGYKRRKKNNITRKVRFYESSPEKIPYFIAQAQDFYALGMVVNPEGTKELYHNIEIDTGIVIQHQEITPNVSKGHHGDTPQNKGKKAQSGGGVRKATVP